MRSFYLGNKAKPIWLSSQPWGPRRWNGDVEGKLVGGGRSPAGRCSDGCCLAEGERSPGQSDDFPRCLGLTLFSSLLWVKLNGVNGSHKSGIRNKKIVSI